MSSNTMTASHPILGYVAATAMVCVLATFNAHAGDTRSETVRFSDLNLSSPVAVEALYGRIHAAARRVCQQPAGERAGEEKCMAKAEADAISKVNVPLLTAFYQKKTGLQPQTITANR